MVDENRRADLNAFFARWYRPLTAKDGIAEAEIALAEARLGFRLPGALRLVYGVAGRCPLLAKERERLVAPGELMVSAGMLRFWNSCPTARPSLAIPEEAFGEADPEIWSLFFQEGREQSVYPLTGRMTEVLTNLVVQIAAATMGKVAGHRYGADGSLALEQVFERVTITDRYVLTDRDGMGQNGIYRQNWFQAEDALIRAEAHCTVIYGRDRKAVEAVARRLGTSFTIVMNKPF